MYGYPTQSMIQPMMAYPGMIQPGMMGQQMMQPGMVHPGMVQPGMMQPGMVHPGMVQPGMTQQRIAPNMAMNQRAYSQPMVQPGMSGQAMPQVQLPAGQAQQIDGLLQRLPSYAYKDRVKRDVSMALSYFKTLAPVLSNSPVTSDQCFALKGNLPIVYKGNAYFIPLGVYITERYPESAPICFVCPVAGMEVNPGPHTEPTGRIRVPYLTQWNMNTSNIAGLLNSMVPIFNNEPPVKKSVHPCSPSPITPQFGLAQQQQQQMQQQMQQQQQQCMPQQQLTSVDKTSSAVEAKLQEQFLLMVSKVEADISELSKNEIALLESKEENLRKEKALQQENDELTRAIAEMQEKIKELSAETQNSGDEFDLEEATKPPTVLETQLADEVAKTHAYDDELYAIDNAFKQKKISLDKYIDTLKEVSREQYFSRALSNKIREVKKRN